MQVADLFEGVAKFSVEHQNGRHKRAHKMTLDSITDSVLFSHAEKKKISKLAVGDTYSVQRNGLNGRTIIRITRES